MKGSVAVVNAGSSSIKFALYTADPTWHFYRGQVEKITGRAPEGRTAAARRY